MGQVASYIKDNGLKFGLTERSLRILWLLVVIGSMVLRYYLRYSFAASSDCRLVPRIALCTVRVLWHSLCPPIPRALNVCSPVTARPGPGFALPPIDPETWP